MLSIAFVSQGRLYLVGGEGPPQEIKSDFAEAVRERALEIQKRHAWKTEGRGQRFMSGSLLWGGPQRPAEQIRVGVTGVGRGSRTGELLFALDAEGTTAVCSYDVSEARERRLLHGSKSRLSDLAAAAGSERVACAVAKPDGSACLALMNADASELTEITEGDCIDGAPAWAPGGGRLVYQSAGIGRDAHGRPTGLGPCEIHALEVHTGTLETLAADPRSDLLSPRVGPDAALYFVARSRATGPRWPLLAALLDILLLPVRLLWALLQYLNFFSARYAGKPLMTAGGPKKQGVDMRQMMVWSNLIEAERESGDADEREGGVARPTKLVRRSPDGRQQVLASGVVCYDLAEDGTVVYATGQALHQLAPDGSRRKLTLDRPVERLVCLG